jgi:ATP-dependent DNA ligase
VAIKQIGINLVDSETGELLGITTPSFQGLKRENYIKDGVKFLEPMTAQELEHEEIDEYITTNLTVAEEKFDGHRALNHLTEYGNRLFSRRVSKESGWFSENTDQVPHIRDTQVTPALYGTVLDNEALLPVEGCSCREMQSVMGALPETAIKNQLERGFAYMNCFDILYYCGTNIQAMPYWRRKLYEYKVIKAINSPYIKFCHLYMTMNVYNTITELWKANKAYDEGIMEYVHIVPSYEDLFRDFLKEGKEGLILKNIYSRYEQKRSKSFIKMKAHRMYDVVIMGYEEPTMLYDGKTLRETGVWGFWADAEDESQIVTGDMSGEDAEEQGLIPVTKFYARDWIGAIKFGVWKNGKLVEVGQTSGLDDALRDEISKNRDKYIGRVIEVEAQHIINKETGSLQHPRFVQFRDDKNSEKCTFNDHIRRYGEDK